MGDAFKIGQRVKFRVDGVWHVGTVRRFGIGGPFAGQYRVDDGDPKNNDLMSNGFVRSAWVRVSDLRVEVVTDV